MLINRDDKVVYNGKRYAKELAGQIGYVVAPIQNQTGYWVIDFPEYSYVMSEKVLAKYQPTAKDLNLPDIQTRRRRKSEDDE